MSRVFSALVVALMLGSLSGPASATPVTVGLPYQYIDSQTSSSLGGQGGVFDEFGANASPNGGAGTTATATRNNFTVSLPWIGTTVAPNQFQRTRTYNPNATGAWNLSFVNGQDVTSVFTPTIVGANVLPFVRNVSASGSAVTPTLHWTIPTVSGIDVNAVRINLFDHGRVRQSGNGADIVYSHDFAPTTTQFTIPTALANGLSLQIGNLYTAEIGLLDSRSNNMPSSNADLLSRSRTFVDFVPQANGNLSSVYLPEVRTSVNGGPSVFTFDVSSVGADPIYIDPELAIGYDYAIGADNPNFRSVLLPSNIGDGIYELVVNGQSFTVQGGVAFDFGATGVSNFRVQGIETSAGISDVDPTAFITALSFVAAGEFTGTMTPLIQAVTGVPEPDTLACLAVGLVLLGLSLARQTRPL